MKRAYSLFAPKKAVNLSLNPELVLEARNYTDNLSAEVEILLADFVESKKAERVTEKNSRRRAAEAWGDFLKSNPSFADEVSSL